MDVLSIIAMLIFGGTYIIIAALIPFSSKVKGFWAHFFTFIASGFMVVGAMGFFGTILSRCGAFDWLKLESFEWPVGYARDVIQTENGLFVVPLTPSSRIQIYDSKWKFIRGWHVLVYGGTIHLASLGGNRFEVLTKGMNMRYIFDTDGNKIWEAYYSPAKNESFPKEGKSIFVPTKPWLFVFSGPFYSLASVFVGFIFLGLVDIINKRKSRNENPIK